MRAGKCRHFRGTIERQCAAGIVMTTLAGGKTPGWGTRLPCGSFAGEPIGGDRAVCASFSPVTAEEEARERDEVRKMLALVSKARLLAPARGEKAIVVCPGCAGRLHIETHSNGHVWARCETKDCISWME